MQENITISDNDSESILIISDNDLEIITKEIDKTSNHNSENIEPKIDYRKTVIADNYTRFKEFKAVVDVHLIELYGKHILNKVLKITHKEEYETIHNTKSVELVRTNCYLLKAFNNFIFHHKKLLTQTYSNDLKLENNDDLFANLNKNNSVKDELYNEFYDELVEMDFYVNYNMAKIYLRYTNDIEQAFIHINKSVINNM